MLPDREAINNRNALKAKRYNEMLVVNKSQHAEITALREALAEARAVIQDAYNYWYKPRTSGKNIDGVALKETMYEEFTKGGAK